MPNTTTGKPIWPAITDSAIKDYEVDSAIKDDGATTEALESKWYTWGLLRSGDCTMFEGARWTLYSNGNTSFDAVVTSGDDNDAWVIREVRLLDAGGAVLGVMLNRYPDPEDRRKFFCAMPDSDFRYRFFAYGTFDSNLYPLIQRLNMRYHC